MHRFILIALITLPLLACGEHVDLDFDGVTATREADGHVRLEVAITCRVTGNPAECGSIEELCLEAAWAEEVPADAGARPADGGLVADGGMPDAGSGGDADAGWDPWAMPRRTGPALYTARTCTQEQFVHAVPKTLVIRSTDAIPPQPKLLINVHPTWTAPRAGLGILTRLAGSQIDSP